MELRRMSAGYFLNIQFQCKGQANLQLGTYSDTQTNVFFCTIGQFVCLEMVVSPT